MDVDVAHLAAATVTALTPFMPILVNAARFSAEAIAEMVVQNGGEAAWQRAQVLWGKIRGRYGDDALINGAAMMVSAQPENEGFQTTLAAAVADRLQQNPEFAQELLAFLGGAKAVQEVLAERNSWVEDVTQEMSGQGTQVVKASDDSVIIGVRQNIKE